MSVLGVVSVACKLTPEEQQRIELARLTDKFYYVAGAYSRTRTETQLENGTLSYIGYLLISENLRDTVGVYNGPQGKLFEGVLEFPPEIKRWWGYGYYLFIPEARYAYKIKIRSHRPCEDNEMHFGPFLTDNTWSDLHPNKYIVIESYSKIE
jgi:hypothetical protein